MITTYLQFDTVTAAQAVLPTCQDDASQTQILPDGLIDGVYCAVDVCFGTGELMRQTGTDSDGNPIMTALPGFHVNVLSETVPPSLAPYTIEPVSPDIVFG